VDAGDGRADERKIDDGTGREDERLSKMGMSYWNSHLSNITLWTVAPVKINT
jgi:hypothetical protein